MRQRLQVLFDKNHIRQTLLDTVFILFLLSLLYKLIQQFLADYDFQTWQISEFLVNYQGGFVRRGLPGEVLLFLVKNLNISIQWTIKVISLVCLSGVSVFFVKAFLKKGYSLYILPLCFFLGNGLFTSWWIRKDYLFFCFFIPVLWIFSKGNLSASLKFILINILAVLIILSHEVFAFFALPILFLLLFNEYKNKGILPSLVISFLFLLPGILAFLLALRYSGSPETAHAIWTSGGEFFSREFAERYNNSIDALAWSVSSTLMCHLIHNFLYADEGIFSSVVWVITFPVIYYIATNALLAFRKTENIFTKDDRTVLSSVLIFQLVCLTPLLTVLSCDYSRVIFYWIVSSFAVFLLVPAGKIKRIFPAGFTRFVERFNDLLTTILRPSKTTLFFLMLIIGISDWKFMVEWTYKSSMLYNVLFIISQPFIWLKDLLFYLFNLPVCS